MTEFFHMGGYAAFVWPALGLTALVMATLYIQSYTSLRARQAELDTLQGKKNNEAET